MDKLPNRNSQFHQPNLSKTPRNTPPSKPTLPRSPFPGIDYHIAWICPTNRDLRIALTFLDKTYGPPLEDREPMDACSYTTGMISSHKLILVCMNAETPHAFTANTVVHNMRYTFPNLRFAMLVGGGASAIPHYGLTTVRDVRLGDVVVGSQSRTGGVVVYELHNGAGPVQTRTLGRRPKCVLQALARLEPRRAQVGRDMSLILAARGYVRPPALADYLAKLLDKEARRIPERSSTDVPVVHFGAVATAKRGEFLPAKHEAHCLEGEACTLQSEWPCLVIRGVTDYAADPLGMGVWREYGSAAAAAFAREFIRALRKDELEKDLIVIEALAVARGVKKA